MAKKYNISITQGNHTFEVEGCDSFDEALKLVNKGIYDFNLENSLTDAPKPNPVRPTVVYPPAPPQNGIIKGNDYLPHTTGGSQVLNK